ncbi:MAG TPA: putative toxin-antitoxin system toxin component, PIN family [Dongiaceae bacterium]|nr:putative toxin-antitoxin system toxin component, PIN family [Dongiaceae bacterium]
MKTIVIDTNTFIAAGWRINAHARRVFAGVARRRFRLAVSPAILEEYRGVSQRPRFAGKNYAGLLSWIEKHAVVVDPAPLRKPVSRDAKDDIFLACALSAGARLIVSSDRDLLELEKPFGIEIIPPSRFIARHKL